MQWLSLTILTVLKIGVLGSDLVSCFSSRGGLGKEHEMMKEVQYVIQTNGKR